MNELTSSVDMFNCSICSKEGLHVPSWSHEETVRVLVEAVHHLLHKHDCDTHGHEAYAYALRSGQRWLEQRFDTTELQQALAILKSLRSGHNDRDFEVYEAVQAVLAFFDDHSCVSKFEPYCVWLNNGQKITLKRTGKMGCDCGASAQMELVDQPLYYSASETECEKVDRETFTKIPADTSKVTRFEVIDNTGRIVVKYDVNVELSLQDEERTLKVFLNDRNTTD